ncbi:MAG TPA: PqqD family protein [Gemmatimonadota bacterium]|nr:PqqD family protein [Gemmatimonadota bacterium]
MHQTYRVLKPEVVADVIDGEAVIMNLKTGKYFSSEGTGSDCWEALAAGLSVAQLVDQLTENYTADRTTIEAAVAEFVQDLVSHMLIAPGSAPPPSVTVKPSSSPRAPFHAPVLNVYSDMQDLLLLDPIHDVDVAGWPMPKSETAA